MASRTEEWYLIGLLSGDKEAVTEIARSCYPGVERYVVRNSGSVEDAEDVFWKALGEIIDKARNQKILLTSKFSTYLFGICKNLWRKELRRKNIVEKLVTSYSFRVLMEEMTPEMEEAREERLQLVRRYIAELPPSCRKLIVLLLHSDKKLEELVGEFGYSYDYAKKHKSECLKKLRELINKGLGL